MVGIYITSIKSSVHVGSVPPCCLQSVAAADFANYKEQELQGARMCARGHVVKEKHETFCLFVKIVVRRGETWKQRKLVVSKVKVHRRTKVKSQDITVFTAVSQKILNYLSCKRKQAIIRISRAWKTNSLHSCRFLLESRGYTHNLEKTCGNLSCVSQG